jgi:Flp pilus assembly pilin Flp
MKLFKLAKNFKNDESGAVTVDWVVLTAALVGLGLAVITVVAGGLNTAATAINTDLGNANSVSLTN